MRKNVWYTMLCAGMGLSLMLTACGTKSTTENADDGASTAPVAEATTDTDAAASANATASGNPGGGGPAMGKPPGGGGGAAPTSYDAVTEYKADATADGEAYASTGTNENAIHIYDGSKVYLNEIEVSRVSSDSSGGDAASFYGVGAAILVNDATAYIDGAKIETDSAGGAGVFAYKDGVVYARNLNIHTSQNTSGGIHAAGGGVFYGWNIVAESDGQSAAAFRSDRGGGVMTVDGGSFTSNGLGSPAIYCTADIAVNDATLTATGSEGICIEGKNSIRLYDCDLTCNMTDQEQNDCTWGIIVYQSMSGDAAVGTSLYQQVGGSIVNNNGGLIYTTNTACQILLKEVDITYAEENDFFLRCTGNANARGWGSTGKNGSQCNFTAIAQQMEGDVVWDSVSTLDFYMTAGSCLTGAFVNDESVAGDGGDGYAKVYIDKDSKWVVTADSAVSAISCEGTIVDADGNAVTIVDASGKTLAEGTSKVKITAGSYSDKCDASAALVADSFADHAVENPFDK